MAILKTTADKNAGQSHFRKMRRNSLQVFRYFTCLMTHGFQLTKLLWLTITIRSTTFFFLAFFEKKKSIYLILFYLVNVRFFLSGLTCMFRSGNVIS